MADCEIPQSQGPPIQAQSYNEERKNWIEENIPQPFLGVYRTIRKKKPNTKFKSYQKGTGDVVSSEIIAKLDGERFHLLTITMLIILTEACKNSPKFVSRTHSLEGVGHTTGFCSNVNFQPNSHKHKLAVAISMATMLLLDLANMIGLHLGWANRAESQFLSWTISSIFMFTHMHRRHELGQRGVYWCFGDRTKLVDENGDAPKFYYAPDLLDSFIRAMDLTDRWLTKLAHRRFSQEYTSWGEMFCLTGHFTNVKLETLVREGLYELCPELIIKGALCREQLYKHQVALKMKLHYNALARPITLKELQLADNLARLFHFPGQKKAPLYMFLMLLGIRKRPKKNSLFCEWIQKHYTGMSTIPCIRT
jgi:hypothetical protein